MFSKLCQAALAVALLVGLAACERPPRPFQPDGKLSPPRQFLNFGPQAGILVAPVIGLPGKSPTLLSSQVARALTERELPAVTRGGHHGAYLLQGSATRSANGDGGLDLRWRLVDPYGLTLAKVEQPAALPAPVTAAASPELLREIARQTARRIDAAIRADGRESRLPLDGILVEPVTGAPGDGYRSLTRALRAALRRAGLPLAENVGPDVYVVRGAVGVTGSGPSRQLVRVTWTVLGPDGGELGKVEQADEIPTGALEPRWGDAALIVADGAAVGIADLLQRAGRAKNAASGRRAAAACESIYSHPAPC